MSDITLSKAVRSNLLSLQNTADLMSSTQNRLATGKKVNSALDNPTNFFTASSLNSRAGDINQLMDSMANGIQTLEAADNGLKAITKTLESMQSTLRQARQDKSFQTQSFSVASGLDSTNALTFSGGAISGSVAIELGTDAVDAVPGDGAEDAVASSFTGVGGAAATAGTAGQIVVTVGDEDFNVDVEDGDSLQDVADKINVAVGEDVADLDGGQLVLQNAAGTGISVADAAGNDEGTTAQVFGTPETVAGSPAVPGEGGTPAIPASSKSVDDLVREINNHDDLKGKIRASNDNGNLRIENLSTQALNTEGVSSTGVIDGTSDAREDVIAGNSVRAGLADQFRELRDQLDKLVDDASFNGINLLRGDNLQITFNETGTSELNIQSKVNGEEGATLNAGTLGIETNLQASDLDSDASIDGFLANVKGAINTVRSQASAFGSSLSIVQNRQDFSKNMINTLQTGAANLTLADSNEEAANLLALQTRQQLSSTALSMASQQDQSVLRLF